MKKGFISIMLLAIITAMLLISWYYIEMLSVNKRNLELMKESLVKEVTEFNQLQ